MARSEPLLVAKQGESDGSLGQCDDDELMRLVVAGSRSAFEALIRRHQGKLRAYCARICGSGAGDEIVQETFITVWRTRDSYEPRGRFRSYLFTIADRRSRNVMRSCTRGAHCAERAAEGAAMRSPLDELIASERERALHAWLSKLSPEQRRAILLHYTAGLEYEEIGEITKRPASTIRARVFSGLIRLRRLVKSAGAE